MLSINKEMMILLLDGISSRPGVSHRPGVLMIHEPAKMKQGILGELPSLRPEDLLKGDLRFNIDFRSVYASILEQHMGVPSKPILGRAFPQIELS